ncbi:MAG: endopeptidase La [Deltaproteobacteria bacterium]|nr:endopeptidase La [Deltaproteobacteria bacterium]MBW2120906.1 endopeptidase La [Deltaproteobacteria bacterium]
MEQGELAIPSELPVLPLKGMVLFPEMAIPVLVVKERSKKLVDEALVGDRLVVVVSLKDQTVEEPGPEHLYSVGTVAQIVKKIALPNDAYQVIIRGMKKVSLFEYSQKEPYLKAKILVLEENREMDKEAEAMVLNIQRLFQKVIELASLPPELGVVVMNLDNPADLASLVASNLDISVEQKQELLEITRLKDVLEKVTVLLNQQVEKLELSADIQKRVQEGMGKTQREILLREQLKAIQKELGEGDERTAEISELKKRIEAAGLPPEAREVADKELDRLSKMPPAAAEYTVSRTYLDWILDVPWSVSTEDNLDLERAEQILNEDHHDLDQVKKRILEYLAVRKLKADSRGPILCFVGPPGVGKTSLGQSIARTMGRKFVRLSLGGVRDEAEIRGHRRTYVGALPGRIIQGIKKAGANNPVFMLDEVDKIGADFRGDPSSALLEVLDPEQNNSFSDHYLEIPFDLSKVMFITTANILDTIPPALRDRMEVLSLPGYTEEEKLEIARRYLIPRQVEQNGLTGDLLRLDDDAIRAIIRGYTREAGVRNLEREIASVCRAVAIRLAKGNTDPVVVSEENLSDFLGPQKFIPETKARSWGPGLATGLAWTPAGGEIIFVEASVMKGKNRLTLTGHLGDVMKESATAALSYIRSRARELDIDEDFFDHHDIHIHVPAGATPKDGPSAGVAILSALVSVVKNRPVRDDIAMTGEITLRGDVLPVGGIKEKVLAARRAGIETVVLPQLNQKDLEEVPETLRKGLTFKWVNRMEEVIDFALGTASAPELTR